MGSAKVPPGERLQKVLARLGLGSRRQIEGWIEEGRIMVDGRPAQLGERVMPQARIALDGRVVPTERIATKPRTLIYHKPEGEVCTPSDAQGRPSVFDNLPKLRHARWIVIAPLDFGTSGVLLFTTDGELAHRLTHPSREVEREYAVRVLGEVSDEMLARLKEGVMLEDGPARFDTIADAGGAGANRWYHVTFKEARNRDVRRLWEAVRAAVSRVIRVRYGNVQLPRHLRPKRAEDLEQDQAAELYRSVGLEPPASVETSAAPQTRGRGPARSRASARGRGGRNPRGKRGED